MIRFIIAFCFFCFFCFLGCQEKSEFKKARIIYEKTDGAKGLCTTKGGGFLLSLHNVELKESAIINSCYVNVQGKGITTIDCFNVEVIGDSYLTIYKQKNKRFEWNGRKWIIDDIPEVVEDCFLFPFNIKL